MVGGDVRIPASGISFTPETKARSTRPLWSLVNENTCCKLAGECRNQSQKLRNWIKWLKRFSLLCSLATAAVAAGTATTTLLLPTSKFDEFRDGVSTFLYVSTGIVSLPKLLTIPERIAKSATAIGQFDALANRLHHEVGIMVAANREDVAVFLDNSYRTFKNLSASVSMPDFFSALNDESTDETNVSQISVMDVGQAICSASSLLHRELLNDPSFIMNNSANDEQFSHSHVMNV